MNHLKDFIVYMFWVGLTFGVLGALLVWSGIDRTVVELYVFIVIVLVIIEWIVLRIKKVERQYKEKCRDLNNGWVPDDTDQ